MNPTHGGQNGRSAGGSPACFKYPMRSQVGQNPGDQPNLKLLRTFCRDIIALRRGDHSAARLKMEQERPGRKQEKTGSS
jgi:hypothetical protein